MSNVVDTVEKQLVRIEVSSAKIVSPSYLKKVGAAKDKLDACDKKLLEAIELLTAMNKASFDEKSRSAKLLSDIEKDVESFDIKFKGDLTWMCKYSAPRFEGGFEVNTSPV